MMHISKYPKAKLLIDYSYIDEYDEEIKFKKDSTVSVLSRVGKNNLGENLYVVYSDDLVESVVICSKFLKGTA